MSIAGQARRPASAIRPFAPGAIRKGKKRAPIVRRAVEQAIGYFREVWTGWPPLSWSAPRNWVAAARARSHMQLRYASIPDIAKSRDISRL